MFKRVNDTFTDRVRVSVEGRNVRVAPGDTVAAAIFAAGKDYTRISSISGEKRGPYCLMGVCYECLVEIDGVPNQQACQTLVREGMQVILQRGLRGLRQ